METLSCPVWSLSWCNNGSFHRTEIIESLLPGPREPDWLLAITGNCRRRGPVSHHIRHQSPVPVSLWPLRPYIVHTEQPITGIKHRAKTVSPIHTGFTSPPTPYPANHFPSLGPCPQLQWALELNKLCINGSEGIGAAFVKTFPPFVVNCIVRRILY